MVAPGPGRRGRRARRVRGRHPPARAPAAAASGTRRTPTPLARYGRRYPIAHPAQRRRSVATGRTRLQLLGDPARTQSAPKIQRGRSPLCLWGRGALVPSLPSVRLAGPAGSAPRRSPLDSPVRGEAACPWQASLRPDPFPRLCGRPALPSAPCAPSPHHVVCRQGFQGLPMRRAGAGPLIWRQLAPPRSDSVTAREPLATGCGLSGRHPGTDFARAGWALSPSLCRPGAAAVHAAQTRYWPPHPLPPAAIDAVRNRYPAASGVQRDDQDASSVGEVRRAHRGILVEHPHIPDR